MVRRAAREQYAVPRSTGRLPFSGTLTPSLARDTLPEAGCRADAQLPPCIHFDGLERDDNTRLTRTVIGPEIGSTVFGTQFLGKRIIRIRRDLRSRSDFQRPVRIGPVEE